MFSMFDELKITMTILKYEVLEQKKKKIEQISGA